MLSGNSVLNSGNTSRGGGGAGSGTVTSFSFTDGNGFTGTVANPTTTPALSLTYSGPGGFAWTDITGTSQALVANNGYTANNASLVTFTLPATAAYGDEFEVVYKGTGGWKIAQNAGQQIQNGNLATVLGVGGFLASSAVGDVVRLLCTAANTKFTVIKSMGNITTT